MKVLVVGNGGREHALCRALASAEDGEIFAAPGNGGTGEHARNIDIDAEDIADLVEFAQDQDIDLVVPGPEASLVMGLGDALAEVSIPCCGPSQVAARLEGSKGFMRELCTKAQLPGPKYAIVDNPAAFEQALTTFAKVPVIKADGLAAGKGVYLPEGFDACARIGRELLDGKLGDAGKVIVLEERLVGTEASLFFACDGKTAIALPHARDHKRLNDGDQGPNTGGMGAISPNPMIDSHWVATVKQSIIDPILAALAQAHAPFVGFLFAGLMLTKDGPKVLEFNVRLGDPEAQAVLPRLMPGNLLKICQAAATGKLAEVEVKVDPRPTCAIVIAATGYPDSPRKGDLIAVDGEFATADRWLDHAGTKQMDEGLVSTGGRVAAVVARGANAAMARELAYAGVELVALADKHFRRDIGVDPES